MEFPEKFKNTKAVLTFLKSNGFKIEKSKIYKDAKTGLLRVQRDKSILGVDVKLYSATLKSLETDSAPAEFAVEKAKKESRKLDLQNEKLQFELDRLEGKYMPRSDFERELAARAAILDNGFRRAFSLKATDFIALVGGNLNKTPDVVDMFNKIIDEHITMYATTENFQVMVIGDDDIEPVS